MANTKEYKNLLFYQQWLEHRPIGQNLCCEYSLCTGNAAQEQYTATIYLKTFAGNDTVRKGITYNRIPVPVNTMNPFMELASFSGKCFYPVRLFQTNGGWEVADINALKKTWRVAKERLRLEFEGQVTESVIRQTETVLQNPGLLRKIYNEDLFLKLYFSLIATQGASVSGFEFCLPLVPGAAEVLFNGKQAVIETEGDSMTVSIDGACVDARTYGELVHGKCSSASGTRHALSVEGFVELRYVLDAETLLIKAVGGNIELGAVSGEKRSWQIKINTLES